MRKQGYILLELVIALTIFAIAVLHTFSTKFFAHLAHVQPRHAGLWHLLPEVAVVFGFWALVLVATMVFTDGAAAATHYLDSRNFTEPMGALASMGSAGRTSISTVRSSSETPASTVCMPAGCRSYTQLDATT